MIFLPPLDSRRLARCRVTSKIWGSAEGASVLVAGSGPSLDETRSDLLRRADLVVATLRAAPIVKSLGRSPDLVVAAGYRGYFVPAHLPNAPYVIDLRTHPVVIDSIPGQLLIAQTDWDSALYLPGPKISGVSSSLAALDAAALLGASRISLEGWDVLESRPGTPGRSIHVEGIRKFQRRRPGIRVERFSGRRRPSFAGKLRTAVRAETFSSVWLARLRRLGKTPDRWNPFWGPDYSLLNISSPCMERIIESQRREARRISEILCLRGYD